MVRLHLQVGHQNLLAGRLGASALRFSGYEIPGQSGECLGVAEPQDPALLGTVLIGTVRGLHCACRRRSPQAWN